MSNMAFADSHLPAMLDLMPEEEDRTLISLIHRIGRAMDGIVDEGAPMDTGAGMGCADLHFTVKGVEYHMALSVQNPPPN